VVRTMTISSVIDTDSISMVRGFLKLLVINDIQSGLWFVLF